MRGLPGAAALARRVPLPRLRAPARQAGRRRPLGLRRLRLSSTTSTPTPDHLQAYLEEFAFRHNHRRPDRPGQAFLRLLELAMATGPVTYLDLARGAMAGRGR